jgi:hypothetical protein
MLTLILIFLGTMISIKRKLLNMLYDMIAQSIKGTKKLFCSNGFRNKKFCRRKTIEMYGLMKHSNYFINLFVSKTFRYFEPKLGWQQRNPLKKSKKIKNCYLNFFGGSNIEISFTPRYSPSIWK